MLSFFDAVASVAALVWALAVGACIFLAIDWDGLSCCAVKPLALAMGI